MIIKDYRNKRKDVRIVIEHVIKLRNEVLYIKATTKRWIIVDPTEEVGLRMYQLVWLVSTLIV
jgi:hypothetical protein